MKHNSTFYWLDLARGLAALVVLINHLRVMLFLPFSQAEGDISAMALYFIADYGHEAVMIFFVLSGFFIIRSVIESTEQGRWSKRNYGIDRLSRLWTVLIPALLLTLFYDSVGTALFPESAGYTGSIPNLPDTDPTHKTSWGIGVGNLFFLQDIYVSTFGSNEPLWSLSYEFWYYILFPLIFLAGQKQLTPLKRISFIFLAFFITIFIQSHVAVYFAIWLLGGGSYYLVRFTTLGQKTEYLIGSLSLFVLILLGIRLHLTWLLFNDFTLGLAFCLLIPALVNVRMPAFWQRPATFLADISYTLYVSHFPLLIFLTSWLVPERLPWNVFSISMFILLFIVAIIHARLLWFLFERNTWRVKKLLKAKTISQEAITV